MIDDTIYNDIKKTLETDVVFTKSDIKLIKSNCIDLFKEFVENNILSLSEKDFDSRLTNYIYNNINESINESIINTCNILNISNKKYYIKKRLKRLIKKTTNIQFHKIIPYRSYKNSYIRNIKQDIKYLSKKVQYIRDIPQPQQRSDDWYKFRHNLLTASSIWKVFGSDALQNSLIYEKCKPFALYKNASLDSPMHWGQKYEPVSIELYEKLYNTKIEDSGCIKHPNYPFIGASPDGINVDVNNERFARMLEIKNVVSRVIDGIPKMEYWIQMQVQMETCNLNECDFLETQFLEYHNYDDFISDGTFTMTEDNKQKGVMLLFKSEANTFYEYAPINLDKESYNEWENQIFEKNKDYEWIRTIHWKLEKLSNILVLRNKLWFEYALPKFRNIWETIIKERETGYDHRAPKKRVIKSSNMPNKCLIQVEKL